MSSDGALLFDLVSAARRDLTAADPKSLYRAAARSMFDALVCMATGAAPADTTVPSEETGPVPLVGTTRSGGLLGAVGANATAAHRRDLDDIHWPSVTHPGSVLWPALLGVGTAYRLPLTLVMTAAATGYQLIARAAELLGSTHRGQFHVSTTAGTIGVAGAVAIALERDDDAVVSGMLHACSTLGGTAQALRERSQTAILHRGVAALNGTLAVVQPTARPVTNPLRGAHGFCAATGASLMPDTLAETKPPVVEGLTVRTHPVTGFAQTLVDAILDIGPVPIADVHRVDVEVPDYVAAFTEPAVPTDAQAAAWSLSHATALAVAGQLPAGRLRWPPDPAVIALRDRVNVRTRDASPPDLEVRGVVHLSQGPERQFARGVPHGHPADPLTDHELAGKATRFGVAETAPAGELLSYLQAPDNSPLEVERLAVLAPTGHD